MVAGKTVTMRTYRRAREIADQKCLDWAIGPDTTVEELLGDAEVRFGIDPEACIVMVNGRNVSQLEGMATSLSDGDVVSLTVDPTRD